MSAYVRQISVNGSGNGGRVSGTWLKDGSSFTSTPTLGQGDTLQVVIQMTGNTPANLNGYMLIGPAPNASPNQADASPFMSGNNQICVQVYSTVTPSSNTYTFAPALAAPNMNGKGARQFELTFVAVDPSTGKQWEEDPEFDTGN